MTGGFHRGSFIFYALTNTAGAESVLELLKGEVRMLAESGVEETEFFPAREAAAFDADSELETGGAITDAAALELYYGVGPERLISRGTELHSAELSGFNAILKGLFRGALDHSVSVVSRGRGTDGARTGK